MSETKDTNDRRTSQGGRTLSVRRTVEQGRVRQNFSHGRSKQVVVEKKRKRMVAQPGKGSDAGAQDTAQAPETEAPVERPREPVRREPVSPPSGPRSGVVLRTLTDEERDARGRALAEARQREIEERERAEQEAQRRAEEERQRREREAAEAKAAEEEARRVAEEEAKAAEEAAKAKEAGAEESGGKAAQAEQPAEAAAAGPDAVPDGAPGRDDKSAPRRTATPRREDKTPPRTKSEPERRRGKLTITKALEGDEARERSLASIRRRQERQKKQSAAMQQSREKISREVIVPEAITIQELANRMAERAVDVIKLLMKQGQMLKINDVIDADTAEIIAEEMGHRVKRVSEADVEMGLMGDEDAPDDMVSRAPVVTVMGHVDHGKTSLLDAIRKADVVTGEAGGITQHIGAYQVETPGGTVTFVDTPGHEAFTAMRARGAKVTDLVVLVVAADDGVMPQTVEAINHARAAEVPIIVAINKIDKPDADPQRVRTELLQHEIVVESMGGDTLEVEVSAAKRTNLDKLLDAILLQSEILELKANPDRPADGVVVEAQLDKGRGPVATVLIQRGTLNVGDIFVAGSAWGRVRALINDRGSNVDSAGPSVPVEVLGLHSTPEAGDQFVVVDAEQRAREITDYRERKRRELKGAPSSARASLEQMMSQLKEGARKEVPVLIKADVQGSAEAIVQALEKLGNEEVHAQVVLYGVGGISESDVTLASASNAVILGFNVRANKQAREAADQSGIEVRYYNVIYDLVDDVKAVMEGLLAPTVREEFLGNAEVLEVFSVSKVGKVAGCRVTDGTVQRGAKVRLIRDNVVIHEGTLSTLKRFKDEVREVVAGQECGMAFENYQDMRPGDVVECYNVEEVARTLD
ncbi:translation initiation factor IF-2 [Kaustia mangrovi]|uniref:Translation initiation factor IF-2 n=1 Tax=Kaustia mangrovi TaxID=2593653 RepID=A0A7S8HCB3_9HYPH|nr:translation initiation factor IF-2 [Kaustia mangrovi]QPC43440.1 translation initiation factor IF-2 [Kaustia mangrovi]